MRCILIQNSGFSLQKVSTKWVGTDNSKFSTLAGTENSTQWYSQYHGGVTSLPLSGNHPYAGWNRGGYAAVPIPISRYLGAFLPSLCAQVRYFS